MKNLISHILSSTHPLTHSSLSPFERGLGGVLILMMILSNNAKVREFAESMKQKLTSRKREEAANE